MSILAVIAAGIWWLGIFKYESHSGFFAPVWDHNAEGVYYIQRDTTGINWGMGWEHFSPPAYAYMFSDTISLRHISTSDGQAEILYQWTNSPVMGRIVRNYRGRIFNSISANITPDDAGLTFKVRVRVPKVPRSESWSLTGQWWPAKSASSDWKQTDITGFATPDGVLRKGKEILTAPGLESFPSAVIIVNADGTHETLLKNRTHDELYPDGISRLQIAAHSNRKRIERSRELRQVKAALVARYKSEGMIEGAAILKAYDEMENLGYFPKSPRLVAERLQHPPDDLKIFAIPPDYFKAGLFQDIAAAIASPGKEVQTGTGTYLKYYDDDLGLRLKAWREQGNDSFSIKTGDEIYRLDIRRFEQENAKNAQ